MSETHIVTVGEIEFQIRRFPALDGLEILGDLQKQFAGPFLSLLNGKQSADEAEASASFGTALVKLSETLDGKTLKALAARLLLTEHECVSFTYDGVTRKLNKNTMHLCFQSPADIIQLCIEVVKHNFAEVQRRISSFPTGPAARFLSGAKPSRPENSTPNS